MKNKLLKTVLLFLLLSVVGLLFFWVLFSIFTYVDPPFTEEGEAVMPLGQFYLSAFLSIVIFVGIFIWRLIKILKK